MEALKRHQISRHRYRSHLTKIITATREIIDKNPNELSESDVISLADWKRQLDRKKEILTDIDAKVIALIENEDELETEVLETEEIQETISQQAAQIDRVMRQHCRTHPDPNTAATAATNQLNTEGTVAAILQESHTPPASQKAPPQ